MIISLLKKIFFVFLMGALTFTPWDILFSHFEILDFKSPSTVMGIAWWVPLAFGASTVLTFLLFTVMDRLFRVQVIYNPSHLAYEYLLITGFYLAILFFRQYPYLLSIGLLFIVLVRLILFHGPLDYVYFLFGACMGPTVELILTSFHLYLFTEPDFLGMPYWLPVFWGNVALAMRRVCWILEPPQVPRPLYENALPSR
jgi:hypothetical protein